MCFPFFTIVGLLVLGLGPTFFSLETSHEHMWSPLFLNDRKFNFEGPSGRVSLPYAIVGFGREFKWLFGFSLWLPAIAGF